MRITRFVRSRRQALARLVDGTVMLATVLLWTRSSPAQAKASKSEFMYQDHPQRGNSCNQCKFFQPGKTDGSSGTCAVIDGAISSSGWCMAFARRSTGDASAR